MKRILTLILCVILTAALLAGCGPTEQTIADSTVTRYSTEGKTTALVPDPEATGELTVDLVWYYYNEAAQRAKEMFQKYYPNVKVNLVEHTEDELFAVGSNNAQLVNSLQAEIMAGRGPDIVLVDLMLPDMAKSMKAGAYADLTPYFQNDPDFNVSDFNEAVLYAGQYNGHQYIVPLSYRIPLVVTTENAVQEMGFQVDKCTDFFSTGDEIARALSAYGEKHPDFEPGIIFHYFTIPYNWMEWTQIMRLDYVNGQVTFPEEDVRHVYDQLKELSPYLYSQKDSVQPTNNNFVYRRFQNHEILFDEPFDLLLAIHEVPWMLGAGETPVFFPYRNTNGKVTAFLRDKVAVTRSCKDMENAYRFIKLLMSPEYASIILEDPAYSFPVHRALPIADESLYLLFEEDMKTPNEGTPQEGWAFINGEPVPAKAMPREMLDQILAYAKEVDSVAPIAALSTTVQETMLPYLYDEASFESCYEKALSTAEIYISE